jgi:hypothetical protein
VRLGESRFVLDSDAAKLALPRCAREGLEAWGRFKPANRYYLPYYFALAVAWRIIHSLKRRVTGE